MKVQEKISALIFYFVSPLTGNIILKRYVYLAEVFRLSNQMISNCTRCMMCSVSLCQVFLIKLLSPIKKEKNIYIGPAQAHGNAGENEVV